MIFLRFLTFVFSLLLNVDTTVVNNSGTDKTLMNDNNLE